MRYNVSQHKFRVTMFPISFGWTKCSYHNLINNKWTGNSTKENATAKFEGNEKNMKRTEGRNMATNIKIMGCTCRKKKPLKYTVYNISMPFLFSAQKQDNPKMKCWETNPRITAAATRRAHVGEAVQYLSLNFWRAQWYYRGQQILFVSKQVITFVSSHENNLLR